MKTENTSSLKDIADIEIKLGAAKTKITWDTFIVYDKTAYEIIELAKFLNETNKKPYFIFPFCTKSVEEMPDYGQLICNEHCIRVAMPCYIGNFENKADAAHNVVYTSLYLHSCGAESRINWDLKKLINQT